MKFLQSVLRLYPSPQIEMHVGYDGVKEELHTIVSPMRGIPHGPGLRREYWDNTTARI